MKADLEMVSPKKIFWHKDKTVAYLAGEPVFSATLELGLTTACNRLRIGISFFARHEIAGLGLIINPSPHKIWIYRPRTGVNNSESGGQELRRADYRAGRLG